MRQWPLYILSTAVSFPSGPLRGTAVSAVGWRGEKVLVQSCRIAALLNPGAQTRCPYTASSTPSLTEIQITHNSSSELRDTTMSKQTENPHVEGNTEKTGERGWGKELFFLSLEIPEHSLSTRPSPEPSTWQKTHQTHTQQLLPLPSNYQLIDDPKRWIITINQTVLKEKRWKKVEPAVLTPGNRHRHDAVFIILPPHTSALDAE